MYIHYFFYLVRDIEIWNYANDTTNFMYDTEVDRILKSLEKCLSAIQLVAINYVKMNDVKSNLFMLGNESVEVAVKHCWSFDDRK